MTILLDGKNTSKQRSTHGISVGLSVGTWVGLNEGDLVGDSVGEIVLIRRKGKIINARKHAYDP